MLRTVQKCHKQFNVNRYWDNIIDKHLVIKHSSQPFFLQIVLWEVIHATSPGQDLQDSGRSEIQDLDKFLLLFSKPLGSHSLPSLGLDFSLKCPEQGDGNPVSGTSLKAIEMIPAFKYRCLCFCFFFSLLLQEDSFEKVYMVYILSYQLKTNYLANY